MGYPSEKHLKPKSREIPFVQNLLLNCPITWKCCTEHDSSVQKFKTIGQLKQMLWMNAISRDLSLRWVLDGYLILQKTQESSLDPSNSAEKEHNITFIFSGRIYRERPLRKSWRYHPIWHLEATCANVYELWIFLKDWMSKFSRHVFLVGRLQWWENELAWF